MDRNQYLSGVMDFGPGSLSARRAWIEIGIITAGPGMTTSLSARRAWIEIDWAKSLFRYLDSRSPQGERG